MAPDNPQLMNPEELNRWVRSLIERRAPESAWLDYKADLRLDGRRERVELAKDVSSFGNERGGTLVYGVPEEDEGALRVPRPLNECGFDIPTGLPEAGENILLDTIDPPLPEGFIAVITIPEISPRALLLIHHPASWNRPHMVSGYEDGRYYRRGNFRAVRMTEQEIEAAYAARRA